MVTTYTGKVYVCDNPKCAVQRPEREPGAEAAEGYHFRGVMHVHEGGGDSFAMDTFACSPDCLTPALVYAWERYKKGEHS